MYGGNLSGITCVLLVFLVEALLSPVLSLCLCSIVESDKNLIATMLTGDRVNVDEKASRQGECGGFTQSIARDALLSKVFML